ncbi:MAG: hypothetical protein ACLRSW_11070 [Christensenellaceae bacterium]
MYIVAQFFEKVNEFSFFDRFCPVELNGGKGTRIFEAVGAIKEWDFMKGGAL